MPRIAPQRRTDLQRLAASGTAPLNRRGMVLIIVLIVIAVLSLAAYHYTDMMTAEYGVSMNLTRAAQARVAANSAVTYGMVLLSTPDNINNTLGGTPLNNPGAFQAQTVKVFNSTGSSVQPRFHIIASNDPNDPTGDGSLFRYGVNDENGKINPNTLMKVDPTGKTLYNLLMAMDPVNMTDDIANSIVFWVDSKATARSSGGDASYYAGLSPAYAPKNGPLDSIDELLLVKGVTPLLLYGYDKNRTGVLEPDEQQTGGDPSNCGWARYLTIYSRELNLSSTGTPRINVNTTNLQTLYTNLSNVDTNLANFIVLYRLYGGTTTLPKNTTAKAVSDYNVASLNLQTQKSNTTIASFYDLINAYVAVPGTDPKSPPTYYASPLADQGQLAQLLPQVFDQLTTSNGQYTWGRININTAPQAVLQALSAAVPQLTADNVTTIINTRPALTTATTAPDPSYQTVAWLYTQAKLPVATLKALDKYITATSQVYRFQAVGYLDGGGPTVRLDVAIDTNGGMPRIVYYRDLTELGMGYNLQQNGN